MFVPKKHAVRLLRTHEVKRRDASVRRKSARGVDGLAGCLQKVLFTLRTLRQASRFIRDWFSFSFSSSFGEANSS